jgi:hypothetical protein
LSSQGAAGKRGKVALPDEFSMEDDKLGSGGKQGPILTAEICFPDSGGFLPASNPKAG